MERPIVIDLFSLRPPWSMLSTDPPLASPEDMSIPRCVESGDEAIALLREHHERWLRARAT